MSNDYNQIRIDYPIQNIVGSIVKLTRRGNRFLGLCPFHGEKTPSFAIDPKSMKFKCFGCGVSGDVIDFVKKYYNLESDAAAIQKLSGKIVPVDLPKIEVLASDLDKAKNIQPAPTPAQIVHKKYGAPAMRFDYKDEAGNFLYATCRFDIMGGKKIVLPYSFWEATDGKKFWSWRGVPTPRSLYGLDRMGAKPGTTIVLVEGEKAADAAQRLLPHAVCMTWAGGTNNIKTADFSKIKDCRALILWPDADTSHTYGETHKRAGEVMDWQEQPGNAAMIEIYQLLSKVNQKILWADPPKNVACGWDAADAEAEGWDTQKTRDFLKSSRDAAEVIREKTVTPETTQVIAGVAPVAISESEIISSPSESRPKLQHIPGADTYYRALGYEVSDQNRTLFWLFNYEKQTALCFSSTSLAREPALFEIAPADYWEAYFNKKGGKIDVSAAVAHIMEACTSAGYFRLGLMRGRGAWDEGAGKVVYNTGGFIIDDGNKLPISSHNSKWTYSRGDEIKFLDKEMSDFDARKIASIFKNVNFERPTGRYLLAGWAVLAPFCGALSWRPHIWVSGPAGSGKSWLLSNVVRPMVGENIGLYIQGNSTEAGIRQTMRQDALPVIFDEAEADDESASARVKGVLELARASSAANSGSIAKGSAGGKSSQDAARMMFCFGSIVVSATQESDLSRISNINLTIARDSQKDARWNDLQREVTTILTPENCAALRARTLKILPSIIKNIRAFSDAFRAEFNDQRSADQLAALVAGAWSLHKSTIASAEEVAELIKKYNWRDEIRDRENSDGERLLSKIQEHIVRLDLMKGTTQMTLGEMIEYASGKPGPPSEDLYNYDYARHLGRLGIIVDGGNLYISNTAGYIKNILRGTPWAVNWHKILSRIPGASGDNVRRFATVQSRAVAIPLDFFTTESPVILPGATEEIPF